MKLAIIELPESWERGNCIKCPFADQIGACCAKAAPSSNNGCGLIVDEGDRDKGPLLKYSRDKIFEMLKRHREDQKRLAYELAAVCKGEDVDND